MASALQWVFLFLAVLVLLACRVEGEHQDTMAEITRIFLSIVLEALPFILIGSLVGGVIEVFVSAERLSGVLGGKRPATVFLAAAMGIVFPVCECAIVPVVRRLLRKGIPLSAAVAFLLAGPIVNPIVAASTFVAYRFDWRIAATRLGLGYAVAVSIGLLIGRIFKGRQALVNERMPTGERLRTPERATTAPEAAAERQPAPPQGAMVDHRDDHVGQCMAEMLKIKVGGKNDGSRRLFAAACRAVQYDLSDAEAVVAIRTYQALRPSPTAWSPQDVLNCVRDAERHVERGSASRKDHVSVMQPAYRAVGNHCGGYCDHTHHDSSSLGGRAVEAVRHAADDFVDIGRFLVIGAFIAGCLRGGIDQNQLLSLARNPAISIPAMMAFAFALTLCSEADAFVAASFGTTVPLSAQIAFLVLGPMLDTKLVLMFLGLFRKRVVAVLVTSIIVAVSAGAFLHQFLT